MEKFELKSFTVIRTLPGKKDVLRKTLLKGRCVSVSRNAPGSRILLCLPWSAEGLRRHPLSGIEKPGSGTEPIHQEHVMCSRFRGSCPSDVKSAVHPEPGFSISLSVFTAALCAPREIQKNPATRSIPLYRPRFQALSSGYGKPPWRNAKLVRLPLVNRPGS